MFLIKLAFWLCVIITLAPIDSAPSTKAMDRNTQDSRGFSTQAAGLARATVSDMASFCDRNPETCATGTKVLDRFGVKAVAVAGFVFDYVSGARKSGNGSAGLQTRQTKAVSGAQDSRIDAHAVPLRQNTLEPGDLEAPWVGPKDGDA